MTIPESQETPKVAPVADEGPYYVIDPSKMAELHRSLELLLLSRRCPSCKTKLEGGTTPPPAQEQIQEIASCCATKEGFIKPQMPLQEIIFRTLLSKGSQAVPLKELHNLLTEKWATPANPRSISIQALKRILDNDIYYGFREVKKYTP